MSVPRLFTLFALVSLLVAPSPGLASNPPPHRDLKRYAVIIVLDGSRPDYFKLAAMPHLRALMRRGTTYNQAFVGQELANTPPGHATIGTGLLPKHDGVMGFLWEDPRSHTEFNPTEIWNVQAGQLEDVMRDRNIPSLARQVHRVDRKANVTSVAAHKCYASDAMGTPWANDILCALIYHNRWVAQAIGNHRPPPGAINNPHWDVPIPPRTAGFGPAVQQWYKGAENAWTMKYALWAVRRIHYPRVLMINLSETDVLGHFAAGKSVPRFLMREFDRLLGQLLSTYRKAGILSRTDIVITADHGMSRIRARLPYHDLSYAVAEAGTTPVYIEHDTAASIGLSDSSRAPAVATNIFRLGGNAVDATYAKVHTRHGWSYHLIESRPGLTPAVKDAYEVLANTQACASGPDVFIVLAPHVSARDIVAWGYHWEAGHLGPQWDDQHIPLIMAGPGIRHGVVSSYPARLVDVAPTVERLLGVPSGKVDGIVLANALTHASAAETKAQRSRRRFLMPVIRALEKRSAHGGKL